jgi:hypothetical protein
LYIRLHVWGKLETGLEEMSGDLLEEDFRPTWLRVHPGITSALLVINAESNSG